MDYLPFDSLSRITTGFVWWPSFPLAKTLADFYASFGVNFISCNFLARYTDHLSLANAILSVTISCAVMRAFLIACALQSDAVQKVWNRWSQCVMHESNIGLEWWNHPLFSYLDLVSVSCATSRIKLLKLVYTP